MDRFWEVLALVLFLLLLSWVTGGCALGYRPPIIDIREQPGVNLMSSNFIGMANEIAAFKGYDAHFKFENQLWLAQGMPEMQRWPFWGGQ